MFNGLIAAPILIFPGILLCFLGWGIVLGIPMILLGILMPIAAPIFGQGEHKGKCPSCGTRMISVEDGKRHACPICNEKFAMEDQHTVGAR
jgi:DNA-directed RNA polymerase subunit RPC12/RpoP